MHAWKGPSYNGRIMLDEFGYRPNVGIILVNDLNQVFWGKRIREEAWQFPQGGIKDGEDPEAAMYRELFEETGLKPQHVEIMARTQDWLHYSVPERWVRREWRGLYKGQKQIWFLLKMLGRDDDIQLKSGTEKPEFDDWTWHDFFVPLESVIEFKRDVYWLALQELSRYLFSPEEISTRLSRCMSSGSSTKPKTASI
jgi:putative (di)nucleoside polyphosphate hydrolase